MNYQPNRIHELCKIIAGVLNVIEGLKPSKVAELRRELMEVCWGV